MVFRAQNNWPSSQSAYRPASNITNLQKPRQRMSLFIVQQPQPIKSVAGVIEILQQLSRLVG
jgi:hypothetical protein